MSSLGKIVRAVTSPITSIFKSDVPNYSIKTDPAQVAAETAQANLAANLSTDNTPTIQAGGQVSSASDTYASRRRRTGSGVSSNLGIGV